MAAGTGKSSTHPDQRQTTSPGHHQDNQIIRINDLRSAGLDQLYLVGPGWHPLLLRLHEQLLALDPGYQVDDLREKLGAARIRITGFEDFVDLHRDGSWMRPELTESVLELLSRARSTTPLSGYVDLEGPFADADPSFYL
ncbi:hypothetical protein ACWGQ5_45335 [Streptomyces sp. NPDC055722]